MMKRHMDYFDYAIGKRTVFQIIFNLTASRSILIVQLINSKTRETVFFVDLPGAEEVTELAPEGTDLETTRLLNEQSEFFGQRLLKLTSRFRHPSTIFTEHPFWIIIRDSHIDELVSQFFWITCTQRPLHEANCLIAIKFLSTISS
ncbi:uncharacterized protein LOC130678680 [Microplitis mediator]|uniref:uncharacterized protein LOC130678680 n=1 Tax=Microplitis mediator TaxID=375433 RepID=UPI002554DA61|nr:uncharacterized protein LOC130678680 [Microplitis mediator]